MHNQHRLFASDPHFARQYRAIMVRQHNERYFNFMPSPAKDNLVQRLLWAFYVPSILIAVAYSVLTPVLPLYASELTTAYLVIGVILAAESFGRVIGDVPTSWIMRRFGIKQTMVIGLWVALVPMVMLFWVRSVPLIIALLFVSGIGHAFYNISRHAYIAVVIKTAIRGRAIGLLGGVFRIGAFVGPIIGGWVGAQFGLPAVFLAFGVLTVATMIFVWLFMRSLDADETSLHGEKRPSMRKMLRDNANVLASAGSGQVLAQLTRQGSKVLIPLFGASVLGLDVQTIGFILAVGSAFDSLFFLLSGVIMDRFGRKWAIVPSFIIQGTAIALMLFTTDALTLGLVSAMIGFGNALSAGTMMTVGADLSSPDSRSEFLSVWRLIGDLGFVGGSLVVGAVAQVLVIQMSVIAVMGAGFGAASLFAFLVPETLQRKRKNE